jgi:hypothetical protein
MLKARFPNAWVRVRVNGDFDPPGELVTNRTHLRFAGVTLAIAALAGPVLFAPPASAFPKGDPVYKFKYNVVATSTIKKAGISLSPPPGIFQGGIDLSTGQLLGSITLPNTTFTQNELGVGNITATAAIVPVGPVKGKVNISNFKVSATSMFNIHIITMYLNSPSLPVSLPPLPVPHVNLVGSSCTTASPISVTMKGTANLGGASKFSGTFVMPPFANCLALTAVINQEIPGPGNTFSAVATPAK